MSSQQGPHGITEQEIKNICRSTDGRVLINAVHNIAYQKDFDLGDILVCRNLRAKDKGLIMEAAGLPEKYQVVHKDEAQLIYVKRILKGGKLGQKVDMIATWSFDNYRFEADPDKMDSILMDQEEGYDPYAKSKDLKKKQDKQRRLNKNMRKRFSHFGDAENYIRTLKVGQRFYMTGSLIDDDPEEREVVSVDILPLAPGDHEPDEEHKKAGFSDRCIVKYKSLKYNSPYTGDLTPSSLTVSWYNFYETKPYTSTDVK